MGDTVGSFVWPTGVGGELVLGLSLGSLLGEAVGETVVGLPEGVGDGSMVGATH